VRSKIAFALLLSSVIVASHEEVAVMPRRIKVGLVGLGSVSQRGILPHLACDDAQERVATVACCDVVPGRARETARKFGWMETYENFDDMLQRADIEVVLIATPIPAHYPQTMAAIRAGKHVYVQKTMTTTLEEANTVVAAAEQARLTVVASPGQMLKPLNQKVRDLIRRGGIGKIYWAFSTNASGGHESETIRSGQDILSDIDPSGSRGN